MRATLKEFLGATVFLVGAFLVLVHFTGFERDVRAIASGYTSAVRTLQGR